MRALAAETVLEDLGGHGDLGVRGGRGGHGGRAGLREVRLLAVMRLRLRRALLLLLLVVRGSGAQGGRLLRARGGGGGGGRETGAGAIRGEGAGDLLVVGVWLVVWRGRGSGARRTLLLLWRPPVEAVRGRGMRQLRRRALAGHGAGLHAGEIGELDAAHQVLGESLHDIGREAVGVGDDVGQVRREAGGGGGGRRGTVVLARLQRTRQRRGEVGSAVLLLLAISLGRLRGRLLLVLLLRGRR